MLFSNRSLELVESHPKNRPDNDSEDLRAQIEELQRLNASLAVENIELKEKLSETRLKISELLVTDFSHIPLFPGGRGVNPEQYLKDWYGEYLKYYGAERDLIYLDLVRSYDRKLIKRLETYFSELRRNEQDNGQEPTGLTPSKIIPDQQQFRRELFSQISIEDALSHQHLCRLLYNETKRLQSKSLK